MDVCEAVQEYLATLKRLEPMTVVGYRQRLEAFATWCQAQNIQLEAVRSKSIDQFLDHLRATRRSHKAGAEQLSSYTLVGYVRVIKTFLNWCVEDEEFCEYVELVTVRRIKLPKTEEFVIEPFSPEQIAALFRACDQQSGRYLDLRHLRLRDKTIIAVLVDTGIRADEICTLAIANVTLDPRDAHIKVFGKGSKWREVPLGNKARKLLREYIHKFRSEARKSEPVFVSRYHQQLTVSGLEQIIHRLGQLAGIDGVRCSPHTFRHTFACNFMIAGGDIFDLSKFLGHSSIEVTLHYLKALSARVIRLRKAFQSALDNLK